MSNYEIEELKNQVIENVAGFDAFDYHEGYFAYIVKGSKYGLCFTEDYVDRIEYAPNYKSNKYINLDAAERTHKRYWESR